MCRSWLFIFVYSGIIAYEGILTCIVWMNVRMRSSIYLHMCILLCRFIERSACGCFFCSCVCLSDYLLISFVHILLHVYIYHRVCIASLPMMINPTRPATIKVSPVFICIHIVCIYIYIHTYIHTYIHAVTTTLILYELLHCNFDIPGQDVCYIVIYERVLRHLGSSDC